MARILPFVRKPKPLVIDLFKIDQENPHWLREIDFDKIRKKVEAEKGPEWTARYGQASWDAALALIGKTHSDGTS